MAIRTVRPKVQEHPQWYVEGLSNKWKGPDDPDPSDHWEHRAARAAKNLEVAQETFISPTSIG